MWFKKGENVKPIVKMFLTKFDKYYLIVFKQISKYEFILNYKKSAVQEKKHTLINFIVVFYIFILLILFVLSFTWALTQFLHML